MVRVRTSNDLTLSILDFYRTVRPQLDLKPGAVSRDLFVDGQAVQLALLYEEISRVQGGQSLYYALGSELDALASNYGAARRQGSKATGIALLTFNSIQSDIPIVNGGIVTSTNGSSFTINNSMTVSVVNLNTYRATASRNQAALDFVGITDLYAVEVNVTATATGIAGNISQYSINSANIPGVTGVTNANSFAGGSSVEDDSAFKRRILGIFSGANTGTATGYTNTVLSDPDVVGAVIVGPGDPLMTRDGTQVYTAPDGTETIIVEGTGGKADIYVYGFRLNQILDSYIYTDKSNKNDPTNVANNHVLGQIAADVNLTVPARRIADIAAQQLPNQPVISILSVQGTYSGANFIQASTDENGVQTGNYKLLKDTGAYAGSPWGFDALVWVDNRIRNFSEDITKGKFNSQDPTGYSGVTLVQSVQQNIQITNENSIVSPADHSMIQLSHYPVSAVTRVFNYTTGERYVVSNQNPNGGNNNTSGVIQVSGSTLPAISDILQVDYTWLYNYDSNWDFDNRFNSTNIRSATDSIDWGYSNDVPKEQSTVVQQGTQLTITVTMNVNAVISVNTFPTPEDVTVILAGSRLAIQVSQKVLNVVSAIRHDGIELYNTAQNNGNFSGFTIYLPTDTIARVGDIVTVIYNAVDTFTVSGISGSFDGNIITLPTQATVAPGTVVEVNYIANIQQLLPSTTLSTLPVLRNGNAFQVSGSGLFGTQPMVNIYGESISLSPNSAPIIQNLRQAPTRLKLSIGGTISPGVLTVQGTTFFGVSGILSTVQNGLTHDLTPLIQRALGLNISQPIPSNITIIRLISFESVNTTGGEVTSVQNTYDVFGYQLLDNEFTLTEALQNKNLSPTEIMLPGTVSNNANLPPIGTQIRVTFYISKTNNSENVAFSKSGSLYTQNIFAFVNSISISSGFTSGSSQSATLTVLPQNQPAQNTRYTVYYDYTAPQPNERITITYNMNQVVTDNTFAIERTRPIGADVLVKAAVGLLVDVTMAIVVDTSYQDSSSVVQQNVVDAITASINSTTLGGTIDSSLYVNVAYNISGVSRARPIYFNLDGKNGSVLSIIAKENQYFVANNILVNVEER